MNDSGEVLQATNDAEDCLIGALLIESTRGDRYAITKVASFLEPSHFRQESCQRIYASMVSCSSPPHQINVAQEMVLKGSLVAGDCAYMSLAISGVPCSLDYLDYAKSVLQFSQNRKGIRPVKIKGAII